MKVYVTPRAGLSRAMDRVAHALKSHAPSDVKIVREEALAEVVVLHAIGYQETVEAIAKCDARGQAYAIIQYCVRTTKTSCVEWLPIWANALCVWSYYDLGRLVDEDLSAAARQDLRELWTQTRFYFSPLGVDSSVFKPTGEERRGYTILTSGYVPETEGVLEANAAVRAVGGKQYHLGPGDARYGPEVTQGLGVSDQQLAKIYSRCRFVAGLREVEGFELPAAEGLLCGARPVMFDAPHYRQWFGPWAVFVPEDKATLAESLEAVFRADDAPVSAEEIAAAAKRFDWAFVAAGFWNVTLGRKAVVEVLPQRRRLLWVGDAGVATGFARATHYTLGVLRETWDVAALGLNYTGDPDHGQPFDIWPCRTPGGGGDFFGVERLPHLIRQLNPDLVVIQNDPWNFPAYLKTLKRAEITTPVAGVVAVDGKNCRGYALNGLVQAIFWTRFGEQEARRGGYQGRSAVVPLGVDQTVYRPMDKTRCRTEMLPTLFESKEALERAFIVGNVNRNQPRKRLDLVVAYFCEWVNARNISDAYLFLHVCPTGENAFDIRQLWRYFGGPKGHLILGEPEIGQGEPEHILVRRYNCMDVGFTCTQGEGFGLTTLEGMACGVAQVCPDWSALGDWARDGVRLVPCTSTVTTPNGINVLGGVMDRMEAIRALDDLYYDRKALADLSARGLAVARRPEYEWRAIGQAVAAALEAPTTAKSLEEAVA